METNTQVIEENRGPVTAEQVAANKPQAQAIESKVLTLEQEKVLKPKDIEVTSAIRVKVDAESTAFCQEYRVADPTFKEADRLDQNLSRHCVNIARMSWTLARISHARGAWNEKLCGIFESNICKEYGAAEADPKGNVYSLRQRLSTFSAGVSWLNYKSQVRKVFGEFEVDMMAKGKDGDPDRYMIETYRDAVNAVVRLENDAIAKGLKAPTKRQTKAENESPLIVSGGLFAVPQVRAGFNVLNQVLTDAKWPIPADERTVKQVIRTLSICSDHLKRLQGEALEFSAEAARKHTVGIHDPKQPQHSLAAEKDRKLPEDVTESEDDPEGLNELEQVQHELAADEPETDVLDDLPGPTAEELAAIEAEAAKNSQG